MRVGNSLVNCFNFLAIVGIHKFMRVDSIAKLTSIIEQYVFENDLNSALYLIYDLVEKIVCEPINTAQIYGSELLDDNCQAIGAINLLKLRNEKVSPVEATITKNLVVYVVSRLQASGGHTAVLADIIRLSPPAQNVILVTGIGGVTDRKSIENRFTGLSNLSFEYAPIGLFINKLNWMQSRLLELTPSDVWLFNSHQDSVAIAAVQPNSGYKLHFYHHGDHHLCLGLYLKYAQHIDIHPMGYHNCKHDLKITNVRYLPMSVPDSGARNIELPFKTGSKITTCTAAGFNKVEVPYSIEYSDMVPKLIKITGGKHIHIGRLSFFALNRIKNSIRKLGLQKSSFVYIPFVNSVWQSLKENEVDLYITSFPYGGARTLIEVMGAGIPVALHSHITSRLLSTFDMAYEKVFSWRNLEELFYFIENLEPSDLTNYSRLARDRYLEFHTEEIVINTLLPGASAIKAPPLNHGFKVDILEKSLCISNQINLIKPLKQALYIKYRRWKTHKA
jgi:hypothetical protein